MLGAGTSSRLGHPKQLLPVDGRPLLQHVIDAAAESRLDEIVVVLGHRADEVADAIDLPPHARRVSNPSYRDGQSTSVVAGLEACDGAAGAAAILVGDQPAMTAEIIDRVLAAFGALDAPVIRPLFGGVPGHPVVVRRDVWRRWRTLQGDTGGRDLIATLGGTEVELGLSPLPDIDTWGDYAAVAASRPLPGPGTASRPDPGGR